MHNIWFNLYYLIPEIVVALGAMLILLFGAYSRCGIYRLSCYLATGILGIAVFHILMHYNQVDKVFGGSIVISEFTNISKLLILLSAIGVLILAAAIGQSEKYLTFEFPVILLLSVMGMMVFVSSNDLLVLYLSLELMSLPLYIMAAMNRTSILSAEAGLKYFILGAVASGIYLFGASLVFGFTGSGNFNEINNYYSQLAGMEIVDAVTIPIGLLVGLVMITVALCFKIASAPFHMWAPDVYQGSPTIVTTFFASASKIAAMLLFVRILYEAFVDLSDQWIQIILFVSMLSMFVGSFGAIMQTNFKRLLAYSSIGHAGFALVGLVSGEMHGVQGLLIYMLIYMVMTIGIFACLLMLRKNGEAVEELKDLAGFGKSNPYLAGAIAILMFSLAGVPPFAGFFAKFYVLIAAINRELYGFAALVVVASVIAAFYYLRVIKIMYFDEGRGGIELYTPLSMRVVVIISIVFNTMFVVMPWPILSITQSAAQSIISENYE